MRNTHLNSISVHFVSFRQELCEILFLPLLCFLLSSFRDFQRLDDFSIQRIRETYMSLSSVHHGRYELGISVMKGAVLVNLQYNKLTARAFTFAEGRRLPRPWLARGLPQERHLSCFSFPQPCEREPGALWRTRAQGLRAPCASHGPTTCCDVNDKQRVSRPNAYIGQQFQLHI